MKKMKKFDCIKMKEQIQNKINTEFEGISDKDKYNIIIQRAKENPLIRNLIPLNSMNN
jgi:hypothetical protein